jgi:hypothetical protein
MNTPAFLEIDGMVVPWKTVLTDPALKAKALAHFTERLRALAIGVREEMHDVEALAGPDAGREAWDDFRASVLTGCASRFTVLIETNVADEEDS